MEDTAHSLIRNLELMNPLRHETLREAISALQLPPGSRGLDIGCGIGDQAVLLAEAVSPGGVVTGVDISQPVLTHARLKVERKMAGKSITFVQCDMMRLPFSPGSFDWVWSVDCVGYPVSDLLPILKGICQVVRPGGLIALLAWSSQQLLPGHAMLEARLNATCSPYAAYLDGRSPREHYLRALYWFPQARLTQAVCCTFVGQVQAPLSPEKRDGLALLFEMLWGEAKGLTSQDDLEEYRRLVSPDSPEFIADLPEYCAFFTYTMFTGRVAVE